MNVQPTNDNVDRIFERYTRPGTPGCSVAVLKDGEIAYKQGYGLANLELNVPNLPKTVFNIGSMAKQFTAFAIALLESEASCRWTMICGPTCPRCTTLARRSRCATWFTTPAGCGAASRSCWRWLSGGTPTRPRPRTCSDCSKPSAS